MRNVYLYPVFEDKASFDDVMSRAAWYFEPWLANIKGFHVGTTCDFSPDIGGDPRLDPAVAAKVPSLLRRAIIHNTAATTNATLAKAAKSDAELLLIWKMPNAGREREEAQALYDAVRARGWLSYVVDKDNEMSHGCNWLWGSITLASREERERLHSDSYQALLRCAAKMRSSRAYVIGTGPNLEQAMNRDFSDGDVIIANSVIKNRPLMQRLNPIAVCACDPIFHAGVSRYAAEFRQTLIEAMRAYPRMFFFAPHRDQRIYLANLPQDLHERLIFVPIDTNPGVAWNFDLKRNFYLVPEGNVLTQMMLPIAAAFHDKVSIVGCDGRPLSQNTYFWSHHPSSQFNDQMQNIQEVHPAFFQLRDYDDHYAEHCADTARIVANLEEAGKRVECLTDSYIPALRARYTLDQRPLGDDFVFVSLNPNLRNRYGHLLGYDEGLREAVRAAGGHFLTLGAESQPGKLLDLDGADIRVEPCFSDNVYAALARRLPDVDQAAVLRFEREFEEAVVRHKREHAGRRLAYYLYMGSLPHAVAMANVCARHPEISATVNTFGECIMDGMRDGHIDQWTPFLQSVASQSNFAVLAITPQLKREVRERCGVDLQLCGHPTGAFPDSRFAKWIVELERAPVAAEPTRLVFPGGFWDEKNFELTCDVVRSAAAGGYACTVRTGPLQSANRQQLEARAAILPYARAADGALSDEDYRALFTEADVAVLPYRRSDWRIRNSSVVVDCLYAGLPMVVVEGTWLGDLVAQYGCGEIVRSETPAAFMAAIERIRANFSTYRKRTIRAARAHQSANGFADVAAAAISPVWRDREAPVASYDPRTIPEALPMLRAAAMDTKTAGVLPAASEGAAAFELTRDADCMFEELSVVRALLSDRDPARCVMVDVGAHSGGSFPPFLDAGWTVHAFEPDPTNRAGIPKRYLDNPRFILDPRALSDREQDDVPFFTSAESSGISGLSAFHNTHVETTRVATTTLEHVIEERGIRDITLLKVDTEGFDLFVLKGMPWSKVKPEVVITEYENNKTERLGYTFEDQIRLLEANGYTVFVSEWWPIVRYGIRHHWRALYPASEKRPPPESWGNLIAFQKPPSRSRLYAAMFEAIDLPRDDSHLIVAKRQIEALRQKAASIAASADQQAPTASGRVASPTVSLPRWVAARMTPGRRRLALSGALWILLTLALTAAAFLLFGGEAMAPLRHAAAGAAAAGWLASAAGAFAALAFLKRRGIVHYLAREPALVNLLHAVNALQRHRRREAIASAQALAAIALVSGATLGGAIGGSLSPWIWAPVLAACILGGSAIVGLWGFAVLLALVRNESDAVSARKYDRTLALMQGDIAEQARAHDHALALVRGEQKQAVTSADAAIRREVQLTAENTAKSIDHLHRMLGIASERSGELARKFDRFRASISELDDAFRSDVLARLSAIRDDFEYSLRRRSNAATAAALAESATLLQECEERLSARIAAMAARAERSAAEEIAQVKADALLSRQEADRLAGRIEQEMKAELKRFETETEGLAAEQRAWLVESVERLRLHAESLSHEALAAVAAQEKSLVERLDQVRGEELDRAEQVKRDITELGQHAEQISAVAERRLAERLGEVRNEGLARVEQITRDIAEVRQSAEKLAADAERRLAERLEVTRAESLNRAEQITRDIAEVRQSAEQITAAAERRLAELVVEQSGAAKDKALTEAAALIAASEEQSARRVHRTLAGNRGRYLNFNRALSDQSLELLLGWAKSLGVKADAAALAFMAHRVEAMETIALGRLAASVETQILRNLVALSVRAERFEALEIGTLYGLCAAALIETASTRFAASRITVVDPFSGYYEDGRDPLLGLPIERRGFEQNMQSLGIAASKYRIIQGFSEQDATIESASDTVYNYLLIDGDHSYEGLRRDFENYAPLVERYGYVVIDDYGNPEYPGVQKYVDETLRGDPALQLVGVDFATAVFRVWRKNS